MRGLKTAIDCETPSARMNCSRNSMLVRPLAVEGVRIFFRIVFKRAAASSASISTRLRAGCLFLVEARVLIPIGLSLV